jgi:hypothetical protein
VNVPLGTSKSNTPGPVSPSHAWQETGSAPLLLLLALLLDELLLDSSHGQSSHITAPVASRIRPVSSVQAEAIDRGRMSRRRGNQSGVIGRNLGKLTI